MINNRRKYAEKGLVYDLHSTAEKISELSARALASDELPENSLVAFDRLVERASSALTKIHEFRDSR